ncbi:hypothetical protein K438DRAFT_1479563, partial [Mycena galopus ATCC 62051]
MWLKSYLELGPDRALWGYVADAIFAAKVPGSQENVDEKVRINPFLQSWKTSSGANSKVKPELKSLLDTARSFQVRPEGLAFSKEIIRQMPIFFHREADPAIRRMNSSRASICLRDRHRMRLVGDAEKIALGKRVHAHQNNANCNCDNCEACRDELGCADPNGCYKRAEQLLDQLPCKWDPRKRQPEDYELPEDNEADDNGWIVFDRRVTVTGNLAEIFRIFTEGEGHCSKLPGHLARRSKLVMRISANIATATGGGPNARAGSGVFYKEDHPKNRTTRLPETVEQSSQTAEMVAVLEAASGAD